MAVWHLLSLDAPTVAMLWTWFIARASRMRLPATAVLAMGIAVWMLYAADRLLDSRALTTAGGLDKGSRAEFQARHYFHRSHERRFRCGILAASIGLAVMLPQLSPQSIRLYLCLGTFLFGYFVVIHFNSSVSGARVHRLPKELAVGVFFSAATFIPTVAGDPGLRPALMPGAILFAVLCSLNCLFIYRWEHPVPGPETNPATRVALRFLPLLAAVAAVMGAMLALIGRSLLWRIPAACSLAAILLLLLHRERHRFSAITLRSAADLCLLTPLLLLAC